MINEDSLCSFYWSTTGKCRNKYRNGKQYHLIENTIKLPEHNTKFKWISDYYSDAHVWKYFWMEYNRREYNE